MHMHIASSADSNVFTVIYTRISAINKNTRIADSQVSTTYLSPIYAIHQILVDYIVS